MLAAVGLEFRDLYPRELHGRNIDPTQRPRQPPQFRAAEVLELVTREACICTVALSMVSAGQPFSAADAERVARALDIIYAIQRKVGHGR